MQQQLLKVQLKLFGRDGQSEVVQQEKLQLQFVEFLRWESTDLCGAASMVNKGGQGHRSWLRRRTLA